MKSLSPSYALPVSLVVLLIAAWYILTRKPTSKFGKPLPGPKGIPLLGNVRDIPQKNQWTIFGEWKIKFGDVVGLRMLGQSLVVLNSKKAIEDLLEKRSNVYSERPALTVAGELCGFDWALFLLVCNNEMHLQRRLFNQCMGPANYKVFYSTIRRLALQFATNLGEKPDKMSEHLRLLVASFLLRVTYGYEVTNLEDEYVKLMEDFQLSMTTFGTLGTHPIDMFPPLAKLPTRLFGLSFARNVATMSRFTNMILNVPFQDAYRRHIAQTGLVPSISGILMETHTREDGSLEYGDQIKALTGAMYSAGADSTSSTFRTFFLTMMSNPNIQKKAQGSIDEMIKQSGRLPDFQDRDRLPYVEAIYMEMLRWGPATPLSVPRMSNTDDVYDGMLIPGNSTIIPNTWGCLHDPADYPNPMEFSPERFMSNDCQSIDRSVLDPREFAFGYGRRICPGRHIAEAMIWITIVTVLAVFDIRKPKDDKGDDIEPDLEYVSGFVTSNPKPYKCVITPRSSSSLELLNYAMQSSA